MIADQAAGETIGDDTVAFRRLDPKIRVLWWVTGTLGIVPWIIGAIVLDRLVDLPGPDLALPIGATVLLVLMAAMVPVIRYRRWAYAVREEDLWIRRGVLQVTVTVIPFRRLQFVDTRQGVIERLLDLAEVVVHTASPGTSGRLVGVPLSQAEELRERLAAMITDDGVV